MADNTTLNAGSGGDVIKTEDCGTGFKVAVSKIYTGAADVNGGPVTSANPFFVQAVSGTVTGLLVGGVNVSNSVPLPVSQQGAVTVASGSVTGLLVGGNSLGFTNPMPVSGAVGLVVGGVVIGTNNPIPVVISSGSNTANLFSFHNADNQSLGSTAVGLNVGGVSQLLNATGNLDRQRETGVDTIPGLGVATSANQYASPFTVNATSPATGSQLTTVSASLSGTNRGAFWAIQPGTTLAIGNYGDPGYEVVTVTAVNTVGQTFTAGFAKTHVAPFAITGSVYNQGRDATTPDGATGQGFQANATYLLNKGLNGGAGGWEGERSAAGELDNATGNGTAVAVEYMWTGIGYDRTRNVVGKGWGSGSLQVGVLANATSLIPAVVPTGLQPGSPILLWGLTDTPEIVYTTSSYTAGASPITLAAPGVQFAHTSASILEWDKQTPFGPGLGPVAPFGISIEEEVVWAPSVSASFIERAADSDSMAPFNLVAEAECIWNGNTFDRVREMPSSDGQPATGIAGEGIMLFNGNGFGQGYDRLRGTSGSMFMAVTQDACGQVLSGSTVRTVQYTFGTGSVSGSSLSNQLIPPQGAGNRIRVLAVAMMTSQATNVQFQSTGSAGTVTNISGIKYLPVSGGIVMPESTHGWFQTNSNEGLNISTTTNNNQVSVDITWVIAGP